MNVGLGWLGVSVGAVGCVASFLLSGGRHASNSEEASPRGKSIAWLTAGAVVFLTLVLWAIAMQRRMPFSPGQGMAWGFLIGGGAGSAAILLSFRLNEVVRLTETTRVSRLASLSNVFYALFSVSLAYSLFVSNPWEALMGFSMGAAMAAILHTYVERATGGASLVRIETWALLAITIAAAVLLSMRHFDMTQQRIWWPMPILIAATLAVANFIGIELASAGKLKDRAGVSFLVASSIAAVLVTGMAAIYSSSIFRAWELLWVVATGVVIGGVICWLIYALSAGSNAADGLEASAASVILVVAFAAVAFRLWSGLGIALGLLGIWAVAIPGLGMSRSNQGGNPRVLADHLTLPLIFVLAIVLFRLFLEEYSRPLRATDLQVHYTFIGALLGVTLPFVFTAAMLRMREARLGQLAILGVALIGLTAAGAPLLLLVLWEIKAVMGFMFGLIAATAFMLYARLSEGDDRYCVGLLVIASQLTAIQFAAPLMDAEITRSLRIAALIAAIVIGCVWLGVSGAFASRRAR